MKPRKIDEDESDDELGEGSQAGDSNAEDETDDEMGEKDQDDDALELGDESDDE
jgi:hypothetical protein